MKINIIEIQAVLVYTSRIKVTLPDPRVNKKILQESE